MNEHTNGLLRQYFVEGCSFSAAGEPKLARLQRLLNDRPRKELGQFTLAEVVGTARAAAAAA